jgi:RHS repeat-associated protein
MCADCDQGTGGGYVPPGDALYARARTEPRNETGQEGVDLGSQNFNWSAPLLGLPGRAGLDLGLSLSYNSLVWTKQDYGIKFNADRGFPGPGFRLGFPTVQPRYYNSQVGVYAYMMVTPAGRRVELRQVGGSNIYESQDGSYTQLIDNGNGTALVRTTDGTQLSFASVNGEMRCHQIKDRNGNFITINYDGLGHPASVIDTLGRTVNFNYDGNNNLSSITQTWSGAQHTWASFTYASVYLQGNFPGLSVNGPNNSYITVLKQVWLHDGSRYEFDYTSWGQVNRITKHAADGHILNYTSYNLPVNSSAGQSDCPRFTERRDWAESWNNGAEVVSHYAVAGDGSWSQLTTPDGTVNKMFFSTEANWRRGLTTRSETWVGGTLRKWSDYYWSQDNESLSYPQNPRMFDVSIYDAEGNRRRIWTGYTAFSLPSDIVELGSDGTTELRHTHFDYNLSSAYTQRRVIGLVSAKSVYDKGTLTAKTTYEYDWGPEDWNGEHFSLTPQPATQHDMAGYGANFSDGRGNLACETRWDVNDQWNWGKVSQWKKGYNQTGSVTFERDPEWHESRFNYTDSFFDGVNRNTFAYATTVTDPDNHSSAAQYNYDTGAVTRTQGPPPGGQTQGLIQTMQYDGVGRIERVTTINNGAYTRWSYPASQDYVQSFSTINNLQSESYSITYVDGAGRTRASAQGHPGSVGGYSAVLTNYDVMGRAVQQTKPTEINASWAPAGDDAAGWMPTYQQYDWQGRPTLKTLPGGATTEVSYGGCGCAGGEVTTVRDERGRRKRYTKDALGRVVKVEELNWDQSVYATTQYAYNTHDRITSINGAGQVRTMEYDGHGRLWRRTTPEQGLTTYSYNRDDTMQAMTDARGVTTAFVYNNRHMATNINYTVPANSGAAATSNVTFNYDAAGNRTGMSNGSELRQYAYDQLSRLTHEDINFPGLDFNWRRISYQYNLAGQLTRVTNPWNAQAAYARDAEGRVTDVRGTDVNGVATYMGVPNYATNLKYRAWGALKEMTYGNSHPEWGAGGERKLSQSYDGRLRLTGWHASYVMGWNYRYDNFNEDSYRVTYAQSSTDATLDRSYEYDQVGRLLYAHSGVEARMHTTGQPNDGGGYGPYSQHTYYDAWGNVTGRVGWGGNYGGYTNQSLPYANNRRTDLQYDPAGNLSYDGGNYTYDATGQQTNATYPPNWNGYTLQQGYDGDGLRVKKVDNGTPTYYLRSSVLGGKVLAEVDWQGTWQRGYVYLGGQLLVVQSEGLPKWVHSDPVTKSQRLTDYNLNVVAVVDLDPWGGETGRSWGQGKQPYKFTTYERDGNGNDQAMFRQYHSYWQRFDQPDPYDGSYNITDPQSLNRYAYVQNDPVNFVDPSGLNMASPGTRYGSCTPGSVVCSDAFAGGYPFLPGFNSFDWVSSSNGENTWHSGSVHVFSYGFSYGSGGEFGGSQQTEQSQDPKGCYEFAEEVARIAAQHPLDYGFARALWNRFSPATREFGGKDFKPEFRDDTPMGPGHTDNSPNQARHYVGGFTAGHLGGETIGRGYANVGEPRNGTPSNRADRALNRVSTRHGSSLNGLFGNSPKDIPDLIRKEVCDGIRDGK